MGTHSLALSRAAVGSTAEAVLRNARTPVFIVARGGDAGYCNFAVRTCFAHKPIQNQCMLARFAAELAAEHNARLVLHHAIRPRSALSA